MINRPCWRPEQTKAGEIRSPIAVRLAPAADAELIFVDTLVRGLRVLRFADDGVASMDDLYMAERDFRPTLVVAAEGAAEQPQTLFLVGSKDAPLRILTPQADGGYGVRDIPLPVDFNHDLAVIEDSGQPPLVVISRQRSLVLLRFPDGLASRPEWSLIDKELAVGQLILAAADFDNDGLTDLALANSGNRRIPPLVLRGPIWDNAAALAEYYTDVERFEPIVRPEDVSIIPGLPASRGAEPTGGAACPGYPRRAAAALIDAKRARGSARAPRLPIA